MTYGALEEKPLFLLKLINPALNRVLNDKATNFNRAVLTETVDAVHGLQEMMDTQKSGYAKGKIISDVADHG